VDDRAATDGKAGDNNHYKEKQTEVQLLCTGSETWIKAAAKVDHLEEEKPK
jgi:hypothetical protein